MRPDPSALGGRDAQSPTAGRRAEADALVLHALAIAVAFGVVFMLAVLGGGRWLYGALGGRGASLAAALTYSQVVFSGTILIWLFNALANVIRGTGNMAVPAAVTSVGATALIPVSPGLIFGWGPLPRLGVAGGAVAVLAYYAVGSVTLAAYLRAGRPARRPGGHQPRGRPARSRRACGLDRRRHRRRPDRAARPLGGLRPDQCGSGRARCLVRPHWLAAAACGALAQEIVA